MKDYLSMANRRLGFIRVVQTGCALVACLLVANFIASGCSRKPKAPPETNSAEHEMSSAEWSKTLKSNLDHFGLRVALYRPTSESFLALSLTVDADHRWPWADVEGDVKVRIDKETAARLVDCAAKDGLLANARNEVDADVGHGGPAMLYMHVPGVELSWGLPLDRLRPQLESLRAVLKGEAAEGMDRLLGQIDDLRGPWKPGPDGRPAGMPRGQKRELMDWVVTYVIKNYPEIFSHRPIEWGELEREPGGNLVIRYKYRAMLRGGSQKVIEQRFSFTPTGDFVSVRVVGDQTAPASRLVQ